MLGAEEVVEELDAGRPLLTQDLSLALPPVDDGLVLAELLDVQGFCRPSVAPSRARRRWYRTAPSETPRIRAVWDCD